MFSTHPMPGTAALSHGFVPIDKKTFSWGFFSTNEMLVESLSCILFGRTVMVLQEREADLFLILFHLFVAAVQLRPSIDPQSTSAL